MSVAVFGGRAEYSTSKCLSSMTHVRFSLLRHQRHHRVANPSQPTPVPVVCAPPDVAPEQVSLSFNPDIRLFDEGTDPDDVRRGIFADSWLLSALSMISAATVGDGGVDEQARCARPNV